MKNNIAYVGLTLSLALVVFAMGVFDGITHPKAPENETLAEESTSAVGNGPRLPTPSLDNCDGVSKYDELEAGGWRRVISGTDPAGQDIAVWRQQNPNANEDNLILTVSGRWETCVITTFSEY